MQYTFATTKSIILVLSLRNEVILRMKSNVVHNKEVILDAFLLTGKVKDEAVSKHISNESMNLNYRSHKHLSKTSSAILEKLEALLATDDFLSKYTEITSTLEQLNANELHFYKNKENGETFLHQLINRPKEYVNEQALEQLFAKFVDKGCDLNAIDSYSWSCLHYACVHNKQHIADYILKHEKFDKRLINGKSSKQLKTDTLYYLIDTTPLQICAWLNNLRLAKKLIKNGADIHDKNDAGWTCLHICARQAHLDFVEYLIKEGANVNEGNNHQKTPLHVSSRHGQVSIAEVLLKAKADVSLVNNYGQSALYVAVTRAHLNVVNLLIKYGSDVNQTDKQQNNTLHACATLKETPKKQENFDIKDYDKSLVNVKIGEFLIENGCKVTKQNYLGRTALHYAAKNNCANFAAMLLHHAPESINMKDIYGQTALFIACKWLSLEASNILLKRRANKDIADLTGKTPLHLCAEEATNNSNLIELLLSNGDDVNKALIGKSNDTPLHLAARNNNVPIVSFLLDNSADVNKANKFGETPLHLSAQYGSYKSCLTLLDGGAKINKTTKKGFTPLHSSIMAPKDSVRIASVLIDYGVSTNQEDDEKITPLAMATLSGNFGVVNLLIEKKAKTLNSNFESVAHICAHKNECDAKCLKLLISTYGFDSLFDFSLTNYRSPLQLCVEKKSNKFLKALISCDNVKCIQWFQKLHSTDRFGVSPIVMAVTSQNYEFIHQLINMWFQYFHSDHHTSHEPDQGLSTIESTFDAIKRRMTVLHSSRHANTLLLPSTGFISHGCSQCSKYDTCLFKPDWSDKEQESGKYFLNVLIRENPQLCLEILNTFYNTDILKWQTNIYLDHLEPCELNEDNLEKDRFERLLTPLETIYVNNKTELVTHPVVKALIDEKLNGYAKASLILDMIRQIGLLVLWTAFACHENYSLKHSYTRETTAGKIVLIVLCILFFLWDVVDEILQIYFTVRRLNGHKNWVIKMQEKAKDVIIDMTKRSSSNKKKNEEANESHDFTKPVKYKSLDETKEKEEEENNESIEKQRNKYFLVEKEVRAINNISSPYKRADNIIDWMTSVIQLATLITHFIDIGQHNDLIARVHMIISTINVIVLWLRQLLVVNGLIPAANLVCMLRLLGVDIVRFGFLYIRIYIPFLLLFWVLFGGINVSEDVMSTYWKECEYVNYGIAYKGSFNMTAYKIDSSQFPFNCTPNVNVNGFENFFNSMFSVFRFIVVDNYDFDNMKLVQDVLAPIICALFLILSAIIGINFFIGLMSNVLSEGAFNSVEAHKSMELLGYVLQQEWRLTRKRRLNHLKRIKTECSPLILKKNRVVLETSLKQNNLMNSNSFNINNNDSSFDENNTKIHHELDERFEKLQSQLETHILSLKLEKSKQNQTQVNTLRDENYNENAILMNLKNDVYEMKNDMREITALLRTQYKSNA